MVGLSAPVQAIEANHRALARRLGARDDRYSQLLAKSLVDEQAGTELLTRSGRTREEHTELAELAPEAHALFQQQAADAIARLRALLSQCDPLHVVAFIRTSNLLAPWRSYFEPTNQGRESSVELVAGLVLTQPAPAPTPAAKDETLVAIRKTIAKLDDLALLRNLSAPRDDDLNSAELRFTGALGWMTRRGTSYEHHGQDLARAVYEPHDDWSLQRFGFTIDDVLNVGSAANDLTAQRLNALLDEAAASGPQAFADVLARGITDHTTFTADDLVAAGLPRARVDAVLAELSCPVGSLGHDDYNGLFDRSPLVERPFLNHDGRYLLVSQACSCATRSPSSRVAMFATATASPSRVPQRSTRWRPGILRRCFPVRRHSPTSTTESSNSTGWSPSNRPRSLSKARQSRSASKAGEVT